MEITLAGIVAGHPRFFQKKIRDFAAVRLTARSKLHLDVFSLKIDRQRFCKQTADAGFMRDLSIEIIRFDTYKSAAVIVPHGLRVAEGFQERIRLQDNVLHPLHFLATAAYPRYVGHYVLRGDRLACAGLATARQILAKRKKKHSYVRRNVWFAKIFFFRRLKGIFKRTPFARAK